ncbi:MAG: T9SS type A sorting domain-containing protein [Bacteroidota bacterium]|nr:T9SS type A sorting domain-containing protein [Bacteroidota bacterium]
MRILCFIFIITFIYSLKDAEAQIRGCTDPVAVNYDPSAIVNDGSCIYNPANIKPLAGVNLSAIISETSGLIFWNGSLWTQNDNLDTNIYRLDTINGRIIQSFPLSGIENKDWEEISQDDDYIYIGDFGNNSGDRKDLRIFRISKNSLLNRNPLVDSIRFSYPDQGDFTPNANKTDFDCEAFIITVDSIYLFTKQWISNRTSLYSLSKLPGNYIARLRSTWNVNGLITGSVYLESKRLIVLSGYSDRLAPFIYLLYDFNGNDFFGGNKRKVEILLPYHQVEGIASGNGVKYFISNEHFSLEPVINVRQQLNVLDMSPFLANYLKLPLPHPDEENNFIISPVPAHDFITIRSLASLLPVEYSLYSVTGSFVRKGKLTEEYTVINMSRLSQGTYILKIGTDKRRSYKIIKE